MVYWNSKRSAERFLSAIFAAHPNLKLDARSIAIYYGEGATHSAIEKRIRFHRKQGEKLQTEADGDEQSPANRSAVLTPHTPRRHRNRMAAGVSSSKRDRRCGNSTLSDSDAGEEETPSKKPKLIVKFEKTGSTMVVDPLSLVGSDGFLSDYDGGNTMEGVIPVKKDEDLHVVSRGLGDRREKGRTPTPVSTPAASKQSPHKRPSLPAVLSQPLVDGKSFAYSDELTICGAWNIRDKERVVNLEKAKAYYAGCDDLAATYQQVVVHTGSYGIGLATGSKI